MRWWTFIVQSFFCLMLFPNISIWGFSLLLYCCPLTLISLGWDELGGGEGSNGVGFMKRGPFLYFFSRYRASARSPHLSPPVIILDYDFHRHASQKLQCGLRDF